MIYSEILNWIRDNGRFVTKIDSFGGTKSLYLTKGGYVFVLDDEPINPEDIIVGILDKWGNLLYKSHATERGESFLGMRSHPKPTEEKEEELRKVFERIKEDVMEEVSM